MSIKSSRPVWFHQRFYWFYTRCSSVFLFVLIQLVFISHIQAQNTITEWYFDKPIVGVRFGGLKTVSEAELAPIARPYINQSFSLKLYYELETKLYDTNLFQYLEASAVEGPEGKGSVIIEYQVQERPVISDIAISGNDIIRDLDILEEIKIKIGDLYDQVALTSDTEKVRVHYLKQGFPDAAVSHEVIRDESAGTVEIRFRIEEGFRVTVEKILFTGNESVISQVLKDKMKTKERGIFEAGDFRESYIQEDIRIIKDFYASNGFIDASVDRISRDQRYDDKEKRQFLTLTVRITENEQFTYGGVTFSGNNIFDDKKLQELIRHKPQSVLNLNTVNKDFSRIQDLYFENGYIFNSITLHQNREKDVVEFEVKIIEKDRAHIENIFLNGNEKTSSSVLLRELPYEVGDVFSKTLILQGLRNLFNTQYFSSVVPETPQGSAPGLMDIVINVEEQSTADVNFGITFGGVSFPISGTIKWRERNFLGGGQSLGAGVEISPVRQSFDFNFTEPWLTGVRWSGGVSFNVAHSIVQDVRQDIISPVFSDEQAATDSNVVPVPDPYQGYWVNASTGEIVNNPSAAQISAGTVITDWAYATSQGINIDNKYTMQYSKIDIGLGVTTGYRFSTLLGFAGVGGGISSTFEYLTYDNTIYRPFDHLVRQNRNTWVSINRLNMNVSWDGRDYTLNPTEGFLLSQGVLFTGGFLFGSRHFIRLDTRSEGFFTLFDIPTETDFNFKLVLAAHSAFSAILPTIWVPSGFSNPEVDTITDLLLIDGTSNGRGWDPIRGGRALWENSIELRAPIVDQIAWGVGFFDAALLWTQLSSIGNFSWNDVYFSFGLGVRFLIPQFPIRVYLAQRMKWDNNGNNGPGLYLKNGDVDLFGLLNAELVVSLGGDVF